MDRRTYLRLGVGAGTLAVAGCLGGSDETVLGPPERDLSASSHPTYGDELPSFSVPDPLAGETISPEQFHGERAILMTFFFTECPDGACPALLQRLVQAQFAARDEGYSDDVAFLAITFDPERDTADVLEAHEDDFGVDRSADNWHFLRPETSQAAMELVRDEDYFGMPVERGDPDELDGHDHGDDNGDGHADDDGDGHDHGEYTFTHINLILLANEQGIVERSYPQATAVPSSDITDDLLTVLEG